MITKIWEGEITRQYKINRLPMSFEDYTDHVTLGSRLSTTTWGNCILIIKPNGEYDALLSIQGDEIEVTKNGNAN